MIELTSARVLKLRHGTEGTTDGETTDWVAVDSPRRRHRPLLRSGRAARAGRQKDVMLPSNPSFGVNGVVTAVFVRYVAEPAQALPTWRAADPLFRLTIMLSVWRQSPGLPDILTLTAHRSFD
jgi:hypothetical protein